MNGLLFIDDEEGVRRSVARALKKEFYLSDFPGNRARDPKRPVFTKLKRTEPH